MCTVALSRLEADPFGASNHQRVVTPTGNVYFACHHSCTPSTLSPPRNGAQCYPPEYRGTRWSLSPGSGSSCRCRCRSYTAPSREIRMRSRRTPVGRHPPVEHYQAVTVPVRRVRTFSDVCGYSQGPTERPAHRYPDAFAKGAVGVLWYDRLRRLTHNIDYIDDSSAVVHDRMIGTDTLR